MKALFKLKFGIAFEDVEDEDEEDAYLQEERTQFARPAAQPEVSQSLPTLDDAVDQKRPAAGASDAPHAPRVDTALSWRPSSPRRSLAYLAALGEVRELAASGQELAPVCQAMEARAAAAHLEGITRRDPALVRQGVAYAQVAASIRGLLLRT